MSNEHSEVLELILKSEGGLNEDEPKNVGGVSYAGITQQAYDAFRTTTHSTAFSSIIGTGNTPESVKELGGTAIDDPKWKKRCPLDVPAEFKVRLDIINAFYEWYFGKYHTWELPEFLQYAFADFVVNAASAAVKIIQRFAGVDDDGVWGSGTSRAVAAWKAKVEAELANDPHVDNNLITDFHEQKLVHYNWLAEANPEKYAKFLPTWKRRCNHVLSDLGHYFENDEPTPKAIDEDDPMQQLIAEPQEIDVDTADIRDVLKNIVKRLGDLEGKK